MKPIRVRDVVKMPERMGTESNRCYNYDYGVGYNSALSSIGSIPISETKLKELGFVIMPSRFQVYELIATNQQGLCGAEINVIAQAILSHLGGLR